MDYKMSLILFNRMFKKGYDYLDTRAPLISDFSYTFENTSWFKH